jgi:pimeloyl-ACP methyl ester carboxylesterase
MALSQPWALDLSAESGRIRSSDGTSIAWFREGTGDRSRPPTEDPSGSPIVLVHGTTADHTTWRVLGPMLARRHLVLSIDRRGRGDSSDTAPYAVEREYEDVAAIAGALAAATGLQVDLLGHSYGGRACLGAAPLAPDAIRKVVTYEGAVTAHLGAGDLERLAALDDAGRWPELLETFLREVVDMTDDEWQAFRDAPVWPRRVAAASTIVRELRAGQHPEAAWSGFVRVRQPVLQLLGSESPSYFREGAEALANRLADGRIEVIEGARHAAHHTHPTEMLALVEEFIG